MQDRSVSAFRCYRTVSVGFKTNLELALMAYYKLSNQFRHIVYL